MVKILRVCKGCGLKAKTKEEMENNFAKSTNSKYGFRQLCKDCRAKKQKVMPSQTRSGRRKSEINCRYGITEAEYNRCMDTSTKCQICEIETNLCYDHNHSTNVFRGVLCKKCNTAIGMLNDDEILIQKALDYIRV